VAAPDANVVGPGSRPADAFRVVLQLDDPVVVDVRPDIALASRAARVVVPLDRTPRPEVGVPRSGAGQAAGVLLAEVVVDGWRFEALVEPAARAELRERAGRGAGVIASARQAVPAPLPGRIVAVWVAPGASVEKGQRLCSLEAMKMENDIVAPRAGTIERVNVEPGTRVEHGDELVVIG